MLHGLEAYTGGGRKLLAAADDSLARPELTRQVRIHDHDRRRFLMRVDVTKSNPPIAFIRSL